MNTVEAPSQQYCSVTRALGVLGHKWNLLLLREGRIVTAGPIDDVLTGEALSATFGVRLLLERRHDRWWSIARPS